MKTIHTYFFKIKNIAIIFLFTFLIWGCKKHHFDYRTKFLGNYDFCIHEKTFNVYGFGVQTDTTYSYKGKVSYGSDEHKVLISFTENYSVEPLIYEDGSLTCLQHFSGEFESVKKIKFSQTWGGLGGGGTWDVTGEKTK